MVRRAMAECCDRLRRVFASLLEIGTGCKPFLDFARNALPSLRNFAICARYAATSPRDALFHQRVQTLECFSMANLVRSTSSRRARNFRPNVSICLRPSTLQSLIFIVGIAAFKHSRGTKWLMEREHDCSLDVATLRRTNMLRWSQLLQGRSLLQAQACTPITNASGRAVSRSSAHRTRDATLSCGVLWLAVLLRPSHH
eukprot:2970123-Amphidinium_carterae.1